MSETPDVNLFLQEHGRLPHLGDEIPPWRYRGLLLYYVQLGHTIIPDTGHRWPWWMSALESGHLDGEIPQVRFDTAPMKQSRSAPLKEIEKALLIVERELGSWQGFSSLVDWLAWGLAVSREPPRLSERLQEELYRSFDFEPFLRNPGDHLGEYLAATKAGGWNPNAFYPTPHCIVELMVQMTMAGHEGEGEDLRFRSVYDCCAGTGRMLMHASNYSIDLYGQDIDRMVCTITLINGALYVPWLAFPGPAGTKESLATGLSLEEIRVRRQLQMIREVLELEGKPTPPAEEQLVEVAPQPPIILDGSQGLLFGDLMQPKPSKGKRRG